jgi:alpha-ribazole phosphatase CobZ
MKSKICIEDIRIKKDHHTMVITRENGGFQTIGNTTIGSGIRNVNSIVYHGMKNQKHPLTFKEGEINEDEANNEKNEYLNAIIKYKGISEPVSAILSPSKAIKFEETTVDDVTTLASSYNGEELFITILVFINHDLNSETLIKLFKSVIDAKLAAMWDMGVINHFSFDPLDLNDNESILIASKESINEVSGELTRKLVNNVKKSVREAVKSALRSAGYPKSVVEYMKDVGVEVEYLVDAGMELVVGVEKSIEIREKLKNQIYHSLEDLNVVSFIIAGIRLEEDYEKHRVLGVDVDDDPAYLYSDEVFGMSVANQIAGTKAIFNFKRYDEAKPGIISELGPVLDDVFAGLIAGCMSKIFEV